MTATTSSVGDSSPRRHFRLSSMESLGFIDNPTASTWTDSAGVAVVQPPAIHRGRHEAPPPPVAPVSAEVTKEEILSSWKPAEVGKTLLSRNIRWGMIMGILMILAGIVVMGLWLYQQPAAAADADRDAIVAVAADLDATVAGMTSASEATSVEAVARDLFDASASLASLNDAARAAAADGASLALEAARLVRESTSFQAAVSPILVAPLLETDGEAISLDEAARLFGDWQARFDQVRSALPSGIFASVNTQLEIVAGDLASIQTRYLDGLRINDQSGAALALLDLEESLDEAASLMTETLAEVEARTIARVAEARAALSELLG